MRSRGPGLAKGTISFLTIAVAAAVAAGCDLAGDPELDALAERHGEAARALARASYELHVAHQRGQAGTPAYAGLLEAKDRAHAALVQGLVADVGAEEAMRRDVQLLHRARRELGLPTEARPVLSAEVLGRQVEAGPELWPSLLLYLGYLLLCHLVRGSASFAADAEGRPPSVLDKLRAFASIPLAIPLITLALIAIGPLSCSVIGPSPVAGTGLMFGGIVTFLGTYSWVQSGGLLRILVAGLAPVVPVVGTLLWRMASGTA